MKYTVYNPSTGQIESILNFSDDYIAELNLRNKSYIEGEYLSDRYYIEAGQAIAKEDNPSNENKLYNFDYSTKTWLLVADFTESTARNTRNQLLQQTIDRVNPVWYASLNQQQQTELAAYRQALLDVPQQNGFPSEIQWPNCPNWL